MDEDFVISVLESMAVGSVINELYSCNLALKTHSGWRYPDIRSAENHWLVANLLLNHKHCGTILEYPYYCDYNLNGSETSCKYTYDKSLPIDITHILYECFPLHRW